MFKHSIFISIIIFFSAFYQLKAISVSEIPEEDGSEKGTISGTVAEEGTRDPMVYTTIAIYSLEDSSLIGGTVSDENGNFEIKKLPYGQYFIETDYGTWTGCKGIYNTAQGYHETTCYDIDLNTPMYYQTSQQIRTAAYNYLK